MKLNSKNSRDYYALHRNAIKELYRKENKNITLEEIKLEKERINTRIDISNPAYFAILISITIMFFNMFIPNIAEYIAKIVVVDKFVSIAKVAIIILYSFVAFILFFITLCKQMEEIRTFKILKSVIDELEVEKIRELSINDNEIGDIREIKKQISDIKIFLGI